jgi:very-short-patch-repair endonuclease/superfamily I DNA/RNA helicase
VSTTVKDRIRQLYSFLKEANQLRFRPVRVLREHPRVVHLDEMPNHESMHLYRPVQVQDVQEIPDTLLRVTRPTITQCPTPPESIVTWLLPDWDDPAKPVVYAETRNEVNEQGETVTVRFDSDDQRSSDFVIWDDQRTAWSAPEQRAREALRFFELFYDIYSTIEKDGEDLELMVGDGHLSWQTTSALDGPIAISHPVLLKRVELRFDAKIPEFTIHETERNAELYNGLFVDLQQVSPVAIKNRKGELDSGGYHPLGWQDTEAFLKALIQTISPTDGRFLDSPATTSSSIPTMWRDPVLFLRKRVMGIATAVDAIVDDIETREVFPSALAQITGTMDEWLGSGIGDDQITLSTDERSRMVVADPITDDDILLGREANAEQIQIIRRLHTSGSVLVQGPPGTGKTHTIGNIIGHLLSQGKSILVTAQTVKALRVVRDNVPAALRPLCVSVLGSDRDARTQLESSIGSITERLTSDTSATLLQRAAGLEHQRKNLLHKTLELKHKLREALENEYREVIVDIERFSPSDAARFVAKHRADSAWIPAPVALGTPIPLSDQELDRLYELGQTFSAKEEQDARCPLPDLEKLPSERQFQAIVSQYQQLLSSDLSLGNERWRISSCDSQVIDQLHSSIQGEFTNDLRSQSWRPYAIVAGIHGGAEKDVWEKLIAAIQAAAEANAKCGMVLHHKAKLSTSIPIMRQRELVVEICEHLSAGDKVGFVQLVTRSQWRQFINTSSVSAGKPSHAEHFNALGLHAELESLRAELEPLWDSLVGQHISSSFNTLGSSPEMSCLPLVGEIRRCLEWHSSTWNPLAERLRVEGLDFNELCALVPNTPSRISEYSVIERVATEILPGFLVAEAGRRRIKECEAFFRQVADLSIQIDPSSPERGCIGLIVAAINARNAGAYSAGLEYARRLHSIRPLVNERDALLAKLRVVALQWAARISDRMPPHNVGRVPADHGRAWTWRQLHETLVDRDRLDAHQLQKEIDRNKEVLRELTLSLIDSKAWGKQLERLQNNYSVRQALVGWLDTAKRLISTRQANRRQSLLSEARKLMTRCTPAVPVWIMPISLVAEHFDPGTSRFDVVIIDEASQADLNALIPLYMARQVIVVGDHEQVTPLGVGKDITLLENLRRSMLQEIPNSHLFDNQSSIYDIGRQSFGDAIRLVEHFRCVPEIIAFSNQLSYGGTIKPLRESNSTHIKPACVSYRVEGVRNGDTNQREAEQIVALIKAMTKHPAYAGKTIGVISMVKESQAALIQSLLHKEIESVELEKRRIQAGISSEFQGDERDIIFLSMVDSQAEEGPLRTTGEGAFELTKKRYNVAASRARDQLWVVHSFDPDLHLRSADLRFRLLQHVKDPYAAIRAFDTEVRRTESPFEIEVLRRLVGAGYRVKTQWQVGYFRIDMVVEGDGKRLALECDGDRYHPIEKLAEDVERQAILERLGWKFVRIRGSAFYRDPDGAMEVVFAKLGELGIPPVGVDGEAPLTDMTLIHELAALISAEEESIADLNDSDDGEDLQFENSDFDLEENAAIDVGAFSGGTDGLKTGYLFGNDSASKRGQIEALLEAFGGSASVPEFMKQLAKNRGYQRVGKLIKKSLRSEIAFLKRKGKVSIENGTIRLPD